MHIYEYVKQKEKKAEMHTVSRNYNLREWQLSILCVQQTRDAVWNRTRPSLHSPPSARALRSGVVSKRCRVTDHHSNTLAAVGSLILPVNRHRPLLGGGCVWPLPNRNSHFSTETKPLDMCCVGGNGGTAFCMSCSQPLCERPVGTDTVVHSGSTIASGRSHCGGSMSDIL